MVLGVNTDELDARRDLALDACERLGLTAIELRTLDGRSCVDLPDEVLDRAIDYARIRGFEVLALATPVLKCVLPATHAQVGVLHGARARATLARSWRELQRAARTAERNRVPFVRIFSGWRVADPRAIEDRVVSVVAQALERAAPYDVELLLENEHDCNVATAAEVADVLAALPGLRVLWDPANHIRAGGAPAEVGLRVAADRIAHVHVKDVDASGRWVPLGSGRVPYRAVVDGLLDAGYAGALSLETHCAIDGSTERATASALDRLRERMAVHA